MQKNIFLTYNTDSEIGQNTALRLQTISSLYGLSISLPSRLLNNSNSISSATQDRIKNGSIILAFGLGHLSPEMQNELFYAISLEKPIVVLNHKDFGSTIDFGVYGNLREVEVDFHDTDKALHEIANFLESLPVTNDNNKNKSSVETAIIGVGLGLLALWALSSSNE